MIKKVKNKKRKNNLLPFLSLSIILILILNPNLLYYLFSKYTRLKYTIFLLSLKSKKINIIAKIPTILILFLPIYN